MTVRYDRIQAVGRNAYVHIPGAQRAKGDKVAPRAIRGKLVGFDGNHIYRVYIPEQKTVVQSQDVDVTRDMPATSFDQDKVAVAPALSDLLDLLPPVAVQYQKTEPPRSPAMAPPEPRRPQEPPAITVSSPTSAPPARGEQGEAADPPLVAADRPQPPMEQARPPVDDLPIWGQRQRGQISRIRQQLDEQHVQIHPTRDPEESLLGGEVQEEDF